MMPEKKPPIRDRQPGGHEFPYVSAILRRNDTAFY
ncbi:hypothetical protein SAJA_10135 [Salinisphaera japonica YTM-1]|uniref:Uncharacterized protein n=1 Tax=Salinisphaera japonica YTM-1 TaxID=1209778 RepID=A0A423PN13_9GAMM|nr:hypothetical protein SAJA_10135 [Salinisphaera japonica YTM-1]